MSEVAEIGPHIRIDGIGKPGQLDRIAELFEPGRLEPYRLAGCISVCSRTLDNRIHYLGSYYPVADEIAGVAAHSTQVPLTVRLDTDNIEWHRGQTASTLLKAAQALTGNAFESVELDHRYPWFTPAGKASLTRFRNAGLLCTQGLSTDILHHYQPLELARQIRAVRSLSGVVFTLFGGESLQTQAVRLLPYMQHINEVAPRVNIALAGVIRSEDVRHVIQAFKDVPLSFHIGSGVRGANWPQEIDMQRVKRVFNAFGRALIAQS